MSENGENFLSSRKRSVKKKLVSHVIEAMPTPSAWGIEERNARGRGNLRLLKGAIYFVRYEKPISVTYDEEKYEAVEVDLNALDPANKTVGDDRRRAVHEYEDGIDLYALENQIKSKLSKAADTKAARGVDPDGSEGARKYITTDYTNARDAERLRFEMSEKGKRQFFSLAVLGAVTLLLTVTELLPAFGVGNGGLAVNSPLLYLLLELVCLSAAVYASLEELKIGVKKLSRRKLCSRSIMLLALTAEFLHIIYMMFDLLVMHGRVRESFAAPICIALWVYILNRTLVNVRVARGFNFVTKRAKRSVLMAADDSSRAEDLRIASKGTNAKISYVARTERLSSYFENALREDDSGLIMEKLYPICLGVCIVVSVISAMRAMVMREGTALGAALSTLCALLTAAVPITGMLCMEIPLGRAVKRLLHSGALLNGWNAVEKFGDTDALALNTTDIFPSGSVKIRKTMTLDSKLPVQEVTSLAAAVAMASGGTLGELFGELVEKDKRLVGNADSITYESEMGISGWVDQKRILLGNRNMMEEHRVIVPDGGLMRLEEFEKMKTRVGHQVLYVAVDNRLAGVYLMEYKAANNIRNALIQLIADGTNIMIYTCDANIDEELITNVFDIPMRYISILDNEASALYDSLTFAVMEDAEALLVTNGSLQSLSLAVNAAVRLKENMSLSLMIQSVCFCIGFLLVAGLSLFGTYVIDPAQIIIMQAVFIILSLVSIIRSIR